MVNLMEDLWKTVIPPLPFFPEGVIVRGTSMQEKPGGVVEMRDTSWGRAYARFRQPVISPLISKQYIQQVVPIYS